MNLEQQLANDFPEEGAKFDRSMSGMARMVSKQRQLEGEIHRLDLENNALIAERDALKAELTEIRSMGTNRDCIDGECQCFSCTRDWDAMTDYASSLDMDLWEALAERDRYRQALAKVRWPFIPTSETGPGQTCIGCTLAADSMEPHAAGCVWVEATNHKEQP